MNKSACRRRLNTMLIPFLVIFSLLSTQAFAFDANEQQLTNPNTIVSLTYVSSPFTDKRTETDLKGAELDIGGFLGDSPFAVVLNLGIHKQDIGRESAKRFVIGLAANYYLENPAWENKFKPFFGIKRTYYRGRGETGDALDCLECSDTKESYSGGEFFGTVGALLGGVIWIQVDGRLSNEGSRFRSRGNDPFGVGPEFDYRYDDIPDPEILLRVGFGLIRY